LRLVGEFVMNHSSLPQTAAQTGAAEFANLVQVLERLVAYYRDLQAARAAGKITVALLGPRSALRKKRAWRPRASRGLQAPFA